MFSLTARRCCYWIYQTLTCRRTRQARPLHTTRQGTATKGSVVYAVQERTSKYCVEEAYVRRKALVEMGRSIVQYNLHNEESVLPIC